MAKVILLLLLCHDAANSARSSLKINFKKATTSFILRFINFEMCSWFPETQALCVSRAVHFFRPD